ncbi:MAG: hypothetical protein M1817_004160 [Caeruleum heppii]|nr:MAG: hypothetical protein M1817_004160 [Caeruleum heppii]
MPLITYPTSPPPSKLLNTSLELLIYIYLVWLVAVILMCLLVWAVGGDVYRRGQHPRMEVWDLEENVRVMKTKKKKRAEKKDVVENTTEKDMDGDDEKGPGRYARRRAD